MPSSQLIIWDVSAGREIQTLTAERKSGRPPASVPMDGYWQRSLARVKLPYGKWLRESVCRRLTSAPGQDSNPLGESRRAMPTMPNPGNIKRGQIPNMSNMPNMADISAMMSNLMGSLAAGTNGRTVTSVSFQSGWNRFWPAAESNQKPTFDLASMMGQATGNQKRPKNQPTPDPKNIMKDLKVETTGQIVLWNPATGQQIGTIKGHGKGINDVVFSRDAKLIASAGTDNTIKIWDVGTQRELRTLTGHIASIEFDGFQS